MALTKIASFDDWIDLFKVWQDDIGLQAKELKDYKFDVKLADVDVPEIEFGHYRGTRKWPTVMHIPDQRIRDALQTLIIFQGDTEFASVEQQRNLLEHAPSDYDLLSIYRVMAEEMRHGWQMSYLLITHFGDEGKREAEKLLQRRADEHERLLGSFNETVENWLDFFAYTEFIDRDGKYQLQMMSTSAFAPLARSMKPMLREESFHLGTGNNGLLRIIKAGKIPTDVMQRYFNKWVSTAFDLFGTDNSSSAQWAYTWGLKGRFDERTNPQPPDPTRLNEYARELYRQEVQGLVDRLNTHVPEGQPALKVPSIKFNRRIGQYKGMTFTIDGEPIERERYAAYVESVMPTAADRELLRDVFKENDWIAPKKSDD
ncbi:MAG: phenylacetate-CoA oxygenase subunit PaaI [Gemmatimonadaceae bacterium]|nr:phenylacetate-CoA oxygenase subunit PaaI [Gemmatimonadaceae bacterium]